MTWSSFKTSSSVKVKRRLCAATACTDFNTLLQLIFFFFSLIKFDGLHDDVSRLTMRHWKILLCFYFSLRLVWVSSWWIKNKTKRITLPFSVTTSLSLHAWEQFIILFYFPLEWLLYPSERTQGPNLVIYWRRPLGWNLEWRGFPKYGPVLDLRKRSIVFVEITSLDKG